MDFETKAREAACKHSNIDEFVGDDGIGTGFAIQAHNSFIIGAQWSRTETIAEILGMLRSEPAISMMDKFSREWADWLSSQLKEGVGVNLD